MSSWQASCIRADMHFRRCRMAIFAVMLAGAAAAALRVEAQTIDNDPQRVIESFQLARSVGDVDTALSQFADNSVVTIQVPMNASYVGRARIRQFLQGVGVRFQTVLRSNAVVQGGSVTWSERDQFPEMTVDSTVYAVVAAGRITSLTYRQGSPIPNESAVAGQSIPGELPPLTWPVTLAAVGLVSLAALFGRPRRPASQSQLDGRLLFELRRQRALEDTRHHRAA